MARGGFELTQEVVAAGRYTLTRHARERMVEWSSTELDLRAAVASGDGVRERPDDQPMPRSDGINYQFVGCDMFGLPFLVAGKLYQRNDDEWWFLVIAAHPPGQVRYAPVAGVDERRPCAAKR